MDNITTFNIYIYIYIQYLQFNIKVFHYLIFRYYEKAADRWGRDFYLREQASRWGILGGGFTETFFF